MARVPLEQAYPAVEFRARTRNWWARLFGQPPECVHLETEQRWMALLNPDRLYLRGKGHNVREPQRPEASLCRACLLGAAEPELQGFAGRAVAFEPDAETVTQYFFVALDDFAAAGVLPEVEAAIGERLGKLTGHCERCSASAAWLWFSRDEVGNLDHADKIRTAEGQRLCAAHGAARFSQMLNRIQEANLFYVNLPYGESGAYLWI